MRHLPASTLAGLLSTLGVLWGGARLGLGLEAVWWALVAFYSSRLAVHLWFYSSSLGREVFAAPEAGVAGAQPSGA